VLDVSDTQASGQLPGCVLGTQSLEELYLTRARLSGPLPDTVPPGSRLRILYAFNRDPNTYERWRWAFSGARARAAVCCYCCLCCLCECVCADEGLFQFFSGACSRKIR
jgi:hypothetical protein